MFNPFDCMGCYTNTWCEIIRIWWIKDCNGIIQPWVEVLDTCNYFWKIWTSSRKGQVSNINENHINTKKIYIRPIIDLIYWYKLRVDNIIYDIEDIFPVKMSNKLLYYEITAKIWKLY